MMLCEKIGESQFSQTISNNTYRFSMNSEERGKTFSHRGLSITLTQVSAVSFGVFAIFTWWFADCVVVMNLSRDA